MSEKKTINTRLILRHADLTSWNESDVQLLNGEVALGLRDSGSFEIRVGTGDKTWNQLSTTGQLMIPSKNVDNLTYDEYRLSSLGASDGNQASFQLQGKNSTTQVWQNIGSKINIPSVDFGPVNAKISALSDAIDTINDTTIPNVKSELCGYVDTTAEQTLSSAKEYADQLCATTTKYVDESVDAAKTELKGNLSSLSGETSIEGAKRYADVKSAESLESSKEYTDQVSVNIQTDVNDKYDELKELIHGGIHFVGKVNALSTVNEGTESAEGYYQISAGQEWEQSNNGDLVILSSVEYVWADTTGKWEKFGDEGDWASKAYVDQSKSEAIAATQNTIKHFTSKSDIDLSSNYGTNCGDIAIVKEKIADSSTTTDQEDKYEYTAYVWDTSIAGANKWTAMDGNYNAENVYFKENITKAGSWTSVGNVTHSANTVETLASKGKNVMEVMEMIMKGAEAYPAKASDNKPTYSVSMTSQTYEYGATATPQFTIKLNGRSYTYGSANSNGTSVLGNGTTTGISALDYTIYWKQPSGSVESLTGEWNSQFVNTNDKSASKNGTSFEITSTYSITNSNKLSGNVNWASAPEGTKIPRSNLERVLSSEADISKYRTASGSGSPTANTGSLTCYKPHFYMFTNVPTASPTAVDSGDSSTVGTTNVFNKWCKLIQDGPTSNFEAPGNYYELFYAMPHGKKSSWSGVDGTNVNVLPTESGYKAMTCTFINDESSADNYDLFVVRNASAYSNKTCKMTWA